MTSPDKEWIEKARAWRSFTKDGEPIGLTSDEAAQFAALLQSSFDQGVTQERERATSILQSGIDETAGYQITSPAGKFAQAGLIDGLKQIKAAILSPSPSEGKRE